MTVAELIERLQELNPEGTSLVYLGVDGTLIEEFGVRPAGPAADWITLEQD